MNRISSWLHRAADASSRPAAARRLFLAAACCVPALIHASSIAVKRGQAKVDPEVLPLVCLEIGTRGAALPVDAIVFENQDTHSEQRMVLSNSFNSSHPDMLTATAAGSISLSLPILSLKPGRYQIKSIDFVGGGLSSFTMNLGDSGSYWFEVKPGCVNYLGGIEIAADWSWIRRQTGGRPMANETKRATFSTSIWLRQTAPRDVKWACEVDPGMLPLPLMVSPLHLN